MDKVQYYESQLDENLSTFPILKKLEAATTVPKTYLFLGMFVSVFISLLFDFGGSFYTNLIGWAFPAYYSFQALEDKETKDYSQWIGYWSIFGFLTFVEASTNVLNYLIPFYYLVKTIFLLWLLLPSYRGAEYTYRAALRPLYTKFAAVVNDLSDPDCPLPSMSAAASSLRASASAAASKLEAEAKNAVAKVKAASESSEKAESESAQSEKKAESEAAPAENKSEGEASEHKEESKSEVGHSTPAPEPAAEEAKEPAQAESTSEEKKEA